jgi:hypothetical protein
MKIRINARCQNMFPLIIEADLRRGSVNSPAHRRLTDVRIKLGSDAPGRVRPQQKQRGRRLS